SVRQHVAGLSFRRYALHAAIRHRSIAAIEPISVHGQARGNIRRNACPYVELIATVRSARHAPARWTSAKAVERALFMARSIVDRTRRRLPDPRAHGTRRGGWSLRLEP